MARSTSKHPTELELEVLNVLWNSGANSGQQIRDELEPSRKLTYQSVMTVLRIMEEKKYVRRKKQDGRFVYRAQITKRATSKRMLRDLVDRIFGGSTQAAMIGLLQTSDMDDDQLEELKAEIKRSQDKGGE